MNVDSWTEYLPWVSKEHAWIVYAFLVIFISLVVNFFQKHVLKKLHQQFESTNNPWDDALVQAARGPITWAVWLLGITFAADIIQEENRAPIFIIVQPIREVGIIAILTLFLVRLIRQVEIILNTKVDAQGNKQYDSSTVEAISKLLRISAIITGALVVLQTLGFSISGVLAFGGIGGLAVGFAAKDLLANFFGGLMIYLDRPFTVGDWIRSSDRSIEGTVENIGWRLTCIRTFDKRPIYVPNSIFTNIVVENPSRMTNRRIYETIGIRYDDSAKMGEIVVAVKDMLSTHPDIDTGHTLMVNFNAFAASSLDFFIYTFTKTTNWAEFHSIKQDVLLKVLDIIDSHGAEVAFPTSTVHLKSDIDPAVMNPAVKHQE